MKKINQILFGAAMATSLTLAANANAQFKVNESDGIAASPKVRQMLNERKASKAATEVSRSVSTVSSFAMGPATSPKAQQMRNEQKSTAAASEPAKAIAGSQPVGKDGIAASPRLRQQLDERGATLMIAPVK